MSIFKPKKKPKGFISGKEAERRAIAAHRKAAFKAAKKGKGKPPPPTGRSS